MSIETYKLMGVFHIQTTVVRSQPSSVVTIPHSVFLVPSASSSFSVSLCCLLDCIYPQFVFSLLSFLSRDEGRDAHTCMCTWVCRCTDCIRIDLLVLKSREKPICPLPQK
ncbi:mCG148437 [Mus musculus]|uniref:Uncharacterized protein n=1 Tax=Mus musculus TaxID=10090 RepID=Q8CE57_MOUSE|nr:mCG148437 [Mus musculus]BAC26227.1 unnamed protein product [Mus musculus]